MAIDDAIRSNILFFNDLIAQGDRYSDFHWCLKRTNGRKVRKVIEQLIVLLIF
jgi:hypothetical protein